MLRITSAAFICMLVLCAVNLYAQSNFKQGFIVTNSNDTIIGYIDYRGDVRNARQCVFKTELKSNSIIYKPFDIQAYRFENDKFYVSKSINKNDSTQNRFMEFLVDGISDLYYYDDLDVEHYIIENKEGEQYELTNDKKLVKINGQDYLQRSHQYIGILKAVFSDCMEIMDEIDKSSLSQKSLIDITEKYHNYVCDDYECVVYRKELYKAFIFKFKPTVAFNITGAKFNENHAFASFDFDKSLQPAIGFGMEFMLPRFSQKVSLETSTLIGKDVIKYNGTKSYAESTVRNEIEIQNTFLDNSLGVKYSFPSGKFRPNIFLGGNLYSIFHKDFQRTITETTESGTQILHSDFLPMPDNYLGISSEIGLSYFKDAKEKLSFSVGYKYRIGSVQDSYKKKIGSTLSTIGFNLEYYL